MFAMRYVAGAVCEISIMAIHYIHIRQTHITYQQYINQRKHARIFTYYDPRNIDITKETWIHMAEYPRAFYLNIHINTCNTPLRVHCAICCWCRLRNIDHGHTLYTYTTNVITTIPK